ncbi:MAG: flagellar basal-body MS-ring/collar protein FliF [Thiohalorhabdus sp.]|uniref:flagellar basal-body MS-ring/collar protein FliF n=1 Tax=Thiohalorhabdus sp. TaxID=3094134 RepID=UPI002FC33B32
MAERQTGSDPISRVLFSIPREKQVSIALLVLMMLAGFGGLIYWANQPEYAVLYNDLDQSSAGSVVDQLEQRGVKYELSGGGSMVKVPAGEVSRVRLALAKEGVPGGDRKGYSLFDQRDVVGMSSFAQRLNYQRALEGELERTVNGLERVQSSRVHLVMPEKALFEEEQKPPSASVALQLENPANLGQDSVNGVANLVASSVEGLGADQVTVVDQNGEVLNGEKKDQPKSGAGDELLAYQRNIERGLEQELTSLVERVVGKGQAEVRVNAAIDDEQVKLHKVQYDPFSKAPRSKQVTTKVSRDGTGGAGGPAGAEANVPEGEGEGNPNPNPNGGKSSNTKKEVTNYEISKTVRDVTRPGGGVKRLTASVLVGGQAADGEEGFVARGEDQLANIRELVANAAGIDPERGDQVTVKSLPIEASRGPATAAGLGQPDSWALYTQLARYAGYVLVTLLVFLFAVRPLMRYLSEGRHRLGGPQQAYPSLEGPAGEGPAGAQRDEHLEQMEKRRQEIEERAAAEEERREHVRSMVQQRQDNTASVIRQWLRE